MIDILRPGMLICIFTVLLSAAFLIYCVSMYWLKIIKISLKIKTLPQAFDGLKILHISDLHATNSKTKNIDIWAHAEKLEFDAAVITGDIIRKSCENLLPHEHDLRAIAASKPFFYVEGNHESLIRKDMKAYLESLGLIVLVNERYELERNGEKLEIIGFADYYKLEDDNFIAVGEFLRYGGFKLLLEHQPQLFDKISNYPGEKLMLCGHTHGGQVRFPPLPTLFAPGQGLFPKYSHGLYMNGDNQMYVSKGIGTTSFPIRFFNRPEISIIELKKLS